MIIVDIILVIIGLIGSFLIGKYFYELANPEKKVMSGLIGIGKSYSILRKKEEKKLRKGAVIKKAVIKENEFIIIDNGKIEIHNLLNINDKKIVREIIKAYQRNKIGWAELDVLSRQLKRIGSYLERPFIKAYEVSTPFMTLSPQWHNARFSAFNKELQKIIEECSEPHRLDKKSKN